MPSAIITLPDGRRAKLSGPSREAVMMQAQRLAAQAQGQGADPNTGQFDQDLAGIDRLMAAENLPTSLPDRGVVGNTARALRNIPKETSIPLVLGAMGSVAAGPVMTGAAARTAAAPMLNRLPLLARLAAGGPTRAAMRFGPAVGGAGAGGAVAGGALEAENPNATPQSIATAAARTGRQMAGAEMLGLGLGAGAAGLAAPLSTSLAAPVARVVQPIQRARGRIAEFITGAPAELRSVAAELAEKYPDRAAATRAATEKLQDMASTLTRREGSRRVIRPEKLKAAWEALEPEARAAIGSIERFGDGVRRVGRFANTEVGRELLETGATAIATAAFGPAAGMVVFGVRQLVAPGPLARWLGRSELPSVGTQTLGGQAAKTEFRRRGLLEDDDGN